MCSDKCKVLTMQLWWTLILKHFYESNSCVISPYLYLSFCNGPFNVPFPSTELTGRELSTCFPLGQSSTSLTLHCFILAALSPLCTLLLSYYLSACFCDPFLLSFQCGQTIFTKHSLILSFNHNKILNSYPNTMSTPHTCL